ncbi:LysR family transcriptional regulator [Catenovulum sp. 2E275]|uniref:LysR family transcriptional regulator n=1 Tax=Catenovulum sp. 2E275 TaxID=2980497 RepID=UPI0021D29492|nr:LysR family transcriptional regulator [Catenovulum sp. 2E275]MCU4675913.1 LysR family transcriptional regulator [Catenovulum sp. 2E275]
MPIKTEDIEAFIAVVDSGSFSAAATLLNQQIAKVSRAVSRLESELNTSLLSRTTRRVELTEEGIVFIKYAREGLNLFKQGKDKLNLLSQKPAGKLRVDAASPFILHQLVPIISEFRKYYPGIQLDLTSHDNIIDLLEHKTDLAIRIGDLKDSNLNAKTLGRSQLHLVASPYYLAQSPPLNSIDQLEQHQLIGFTDSPNLNNWFFSSDYKLNFALTASSGETVRQLCLAGQGIALLSNFMIRDDIDSGALVEVLTQHIPTPNKREKVTAVYYKNNAVSSRIGAFLEFIAPRVKL